MMRLWIIALSVLFFAACATPPVKESGLSQIKAGGIHEECASAKSGQKFSYSFYASMPVDFNVHYHVGDKVEYPLERHDVTTADGTYVPDHEDIYCLMWTNNQKTLVTINYKYEIQSVVRQTAPPAINRPDSQTPSRSGY
ncbi:MAG TPA: hypothetical protein VMB78_10910 [Dissulfurispiraceae bacterium]|nr:hypothetical protein [Dissulfurispiraceae bacterium]